MYATCIDDGWDGEEVAVSTTYHRKARKEHRCGECGETIARGAKYEYVKGLCDGYWFSHKTCWSCKVMRDSIFHTWIYGSVWESFEYNYGFSPFKVPDDG